jgi:hypothetical protein
MKRPLPIKKVSTKLDVLRFPTAAEHPAWKHCLHCDSPLSLSQPDLGSPDRLLGVCEQCKYWFFIHLIPDQTEWILCQLPDSEVIQQISFDNPSEGTFKTGNAPKSK